MSEEKEHKELRTTLLCLKCGEETEHRLQYYKDMIQTITCLKCGNKVEINRKWLEEIFSTDFVERLLTYPLQLSESIKKAMVMLLPFVPKRLIKEPYEVAKEIIEVLRKED